MPEVTILIVDDSGVMRKILKHHLSQIGYTKIIEANNGTEGLKKLSQEKINLIISDWNMPEMNGLQFLHAVRSQYQDVPIIMVTTVNTEDEVVAALKAGASNYITKPFTRDNLKMKIDQVLKIK